MEKPTTSSTCQRVDSLQSAISTTIWRSRSKRYDINNSSDWTGGSMTVVEVGDVLDHGGDEIKILYFLERLQWQAVKASSKVITMNGNHETLNMERDFLYMSELGCERVQGLGAQQHDVSRAIEILRRHPTQMEHAWPDPLFHLLFLFLCFQCVCVCFFSF